MTSALICASHSPLLHCFQKPPQDWGKIESAFSDMAAFVEDFDPQLVVILGSDHFNGVFLKMMPAFCIALKAEATSDIGGYAGPVSVDESEAFKLTSHLRDADFDPAVSYQMTLDHAFSQTLYKATGALDRYPTIPIFINCITRPFVPFRRTRLFGEALGRYAASLQKRVLFLASGGMSHHPTRYYPDPADAEAPVAAWQLSGGTIPPSMSPPQWLDRLEVMHHEGAGMIARGERTAKDMRLNPESDKRFLDVLLSGDYKGFDGWDAEQLINEGGIGSMELHTWIAAAAAHGAMGGAPPSLDLYTVAPEIGIACGIVHA